MTKPASTKKVLVVVLGELARSPRMQYHCSSLASNNYQVSLFANKGGSCEDLDRNPNITQCLVDEAPNFRKYLPAFLAYIIKPIWQSFELIYHLCLISLVHVIILQNPPSIPTLPILYLYSRLTGSKLIIDWHNYGYTILSLSLKPTHPIVRISKWIEIFFGRLADAGFCVSEAMRKDLVENHGINYPLYVLYDKPPKHFKPLSLREKHKFFLKMKSEFLEFRSPSEDVFRQDEVPSIASCETRFTISDRFNKNVIYPRPDKPAIIISSTSWTEDEDFGLLLDALRYYDLAKSNKNLIAQNSDEEQEEQELPNLVCVITGKGPMKSYYEEQIKKCNFEHVQVILPWLSQGDYSKMVASCDIGISLHSSSSKVDLPMKVVDMFGCGVPVLAYDYQAIGELVVQDFYGLTFTDSADLFSKMALLLKQNTLLDDYRKNIKRRFLLSRWEDNWNREAKPVIDRLHSVSTKKISEKRKANKSA